MKQDHGYIHIEPVLGDHYIFGSQLSASGDILQPDGQWDAFLPDDEVQNVNGFEPNACVTFGTLNSVETLIFKVFNERRNYSDRFLAKISGTDPDRGNDPHTVAETLRKKGVVKETQWTDEGVTSLSMFYQEVPDSLKSVAIEFIAEFEFGHDWVIPVTQEKIKNALKYSPVGMSVFAWEQDENGLYYKPQGESDCHYVMCYGYEEGQYWKVFDSYTSTHKKYRWDAVPQAVKHYTLKRQTKVQSTAWQMFIQFLNSLWPFS